MSKSTPPARPGALTRKKRDGERDPQRAGKPGEDEAPAASPESPPAGPHAKPGLTNPQSTPGAGLLPDPDDPSNMPDSTSS